MRSRLTGGRLDNICEHNKMHVPPIRGDGACLRAKRMMRTAMLKRRDAVPLADRARAARRCHDNLLPLLEHIHPSRAAVISGYLPIRSEIDIVPALRICAQGGHRLVLPVTQGEDGGLLFRLWDLSDNLCDAGFGTRGPPADAPVCDPDIIIAPLCAFDRNGGRMGYGKGHYDNAIAALAARRIVHTIGVAYGMQQVAAVPRQAHDQLLHWMVTDEQVIDCRRASAEQER